MKLHPALKRLLTECVPPVGQVRAMVSRDLVMQAKDAATVKVMVQKELAHHLAKMIIEDGRGTYTENKRFEYDAVEHHLTLHALSPMELNALVIAAFEAGRKVGRQEVFDQAVDEMLKGAYVKRNPALQKFENGLKDL